MGESPGDNRKRRFKILGGVLAVAAVVGGIIWLFGRNSVSTDDAFIDGTVVNVSPQVGGRVAAVHFSDNDQVKEGDLLVEIDPRDYQAALAAAQANLGAAKAKQEAALAALDLTKVTSGADYTRAVSALAGARQTAVAAEADANRAGADVKRYRELFDGNNASRQRLEQVDAEGRATQARFRAAQAAVAQAEAQVRSADTAAQLVAVKEAELALALSGVEQAEAALKTAELNLSYTRLTAPQAGRVSKKAVSVGDSVQKDQTLTQLVAGALWVVANFKETQLSRMHAGQPVRIRVDAFPDLELTGHVDSIQPGTGSRFSLLPAENATGNFVKVVQRVPVKILLDRSDRADALSLGMSVVPVVDVGGK